MVVNELSAGIVGNDSHRFPSLDEPIAQYAAGLAIEDRYGKAKAGRAMDMHVKINYAVYHNVVTSLLEEVLSIQSEGNPTRAAKFVEKYARWEEERHGNLASRIRDAIKYRYRLVRYAALGE